MEKRILGKTGMEVTLLGFGGAEIGYEGATQETVTQLLNEALDEGLNVIDTAECYLGSEELIGSAVSHRRNEYYLFTKVGHPDGSGAGEDWSRHSILKSIERSLKRMKTDYLDLVQLHSCSENVLRQAEAIDALILARTKGYTRFIGYSGENEAANYAIKCGEFDTLQTSINVADQHVIETNLPLAAQANLGVIVKRPIANAVWRSSEKPENEYHHTYWERIQKLQFEFLQKPLKESIATAMRFTASLPGVHTMIVGTKQPGRWRENAEMLAQGSLPLEEMNAIMARWKEVAGEDWEGQI